MSLLSAHWYIHIRAATDVGMVAELAAKRKLMKYSNLPTNLIFQPIAVENFGAFSSSSSDFISALDHTVSSVSGKERETSFLFQHLSVALQQFNAVLLHDTFVSKRRFGPIAITALFLLLLTLGNYTPSGIK